MKTVFELIFIFICLGQFSAADTTHIHVGWDGFSYNQPDDRDKIGLALSGGGARGLAQVGILKAFEEANLKIGAIAGTSIGGIIGGLYAAGYSADSLRSIIKTTDFTDFFSNRPIRNSMFLTQRPEKDRYLLSIRFDGLSPYIPRALTAAQRLSNLLSSLTLRANYISGGNFLELKYPFCSVTTDIVTGRQVDLTSGNLADAIRSTMAFPLAFTGVDVDSMLLMDGGIMNPIPVTAIPDENADLDIIVAVNTTSSLLPKEAIKDPIDIANQVTSIMQIEKIEAGLKQAHVVITPEINDYYSNDFKCADKLIELGYQAGKNAVPEISAKLRLKRQADSIYIGVVQIIAEPAEFAVSDFPIKSGSVIEKKALKAIAGQIYRDNNLFFLAIDVIPTDSNLFGYQVYDMIINLVGMPRLSDLKINISGNDIIDDSTIISVLTDAWDDRSSYGLKKFSDILNILYSSEGYDLTRVRQIDYSPERSSLHIIIDEADIERIDISGNKRTKDWLIKSSFALRPGKPFNSHDASDGINNIYGTDLFDRVIMNIVPDTNGAVMKITVEEKKYTQVRMGWHWHDEYKSEQFVELLDDNLFGTGQEYLMHAQYAPRRQKYEIYLKADRFFSTYLTYQVMTYYRLLQRNIYDPGGEKIGDVHEDRLGIELVLGRQIERFGTVSGEIRWEDIENRYSPDGNYQKIKLRTATLQSHVETINKYPFPTHGKKHIFYLEFAAEILGGETKYTKGFSSVESYFPITDRINFHPKLSIGWTTTNSAVPESEKFYLGGPYSFHGYKTDQLAGAKMILGNVDLRFRLPYGFYLSGHYDFGEVYNSIEQIKLRNLRHGYGASMAYDSPIGPIDIGYGKTSSEPGCIYVNIGLAF